MSATPEPVPAQSTSPDPSRPVELEILEEQQQATELLIILLASGSPHGEKFADVVSKFRKTLAESKDPPSEAYIGVLDRVSTTVEALHDARRASR